MKDVSKMALHEIVEDFEKAKEAFGSSAETDTIVRILRELIELKKELEKVKK